MLRAPELNELTKKPSDLRRLSRAFFVNYELTKLAVTRLLRSEGFLRNFVYTHPQESA